MEPGLLHRDVLELSDSAPPPKPARGGRLGEDDTTLDPDIGGGHIEGVWFGLRRATGNRPLHAGPMLAGPALNSDDAVALWRVSLQPAQSKSLYTTTFGGLATH